MNSGLNLRVLLVTPCPYRDARPLKTLSLKNVHCLRSLVMTKSCCVVTPTSVISFIMLMYFYPGLPLLLQLEFIPVTAEFQDRWLSSHVQKMSSVVSSSLPAAFSYLQQTPRCSHYFLFLSNWLLAFSSKTTSPSPPLSAPSTCLPSTLQNHIVVSTRHMFYGSHPRVHCYVAIGKEVTHFPECRFCSAHLPLYFHIWPAICCHNTL